MVNFSEASTIIWFRDNFIPLKNANINILTTTAQYGINVFEGVRCYFNNDIKQLYCFRLNEHISRLFESAKLMRFKLDEIYTTDFFIERICKMLLSNNVNEDVYVKIGFFLDGDGSWSGLSPISPFIVPFAKGRIFHNKPGVDCCISSWERIGDSNVPPRIKAGANYINSRFAHLEAINNNYDLAVFLGTNRKVAEGTGSCLFMVRNGDLVTSPVTCSILESITRNSVIRVAKDEFKINVIEREIDRTELYLADELFFVGTSVEILPILSIDRIDINNRMVGSVTQLLKDKYLQIVYGKSFQYLNWLTSIY